MLNCRVGHLVFDQSKNEVAHHAWRKVRDVSGCLPLEIRIEGGGRRCSAKTFSGRHRQIASRSILAKAARRRPGDISSMCITNDHSTIQPGESRSRKRELPESGVIFVAARDCFHAGKCPEMRAFSPGHMPRRKSSQTGWRSARGSNPRGLLLCWLATHCFWPLLY